MYVSLLEYYLRSGCMVVTVQGSQKNGRFRKQSRNSVYVAVNSSA